MNGKKLFSSVSALALTLLLGNSLALSTQAATPSEAVMELRPGVSIQVDGTARDFYNAQGTEVHPIFYNGTHYLPVRAIGELMGRNVNWDQATLTITLSGNRTTGTVQGTPDYTAVQRSILAQIRPDFTIIVDGTVRTFRDEQGIVVNPVLYEGTTYLPVRAIGELMGKGVSWNAARMIISLNQTGGSLVTDADTFGQTVSAPTVTPSAGTPIGEEQARSLALSHAGLSSAQVIFVRTYLDWDNGRQVYDVEFYWVDGSVVREYDYEIDALTGAIRDVDYDAEYYTRPVTSTPAPSTGTISESRAREIALGHAGLTSTQVTFVRAYLDRDDGRQVYDVEFYQVDGPVAREYDYEIDALTGAIRDVDYDAEYYTRPVTSTPSTGTISASKAKEIALSRVSGATTSHIREFEQDYENGRLEYEGKIVYQTREYEFTIDATSGAIRKWEVESIYD